MGQFRLSEHPLFRRVPLELLDELLKEAELFPVSKGEKIYERHRFRRCLGVVLEGRVQVKRGSLLVSTLGAGDLFGAAALFNCQDDYPTTLEALDDCRLLLLSQEQVRALIGRCGDFAEDYVTYLSGRIRFLSSRLDAVSAERSDAKLARYLLTEDGGEGAVTLSATRLCQELGVGRATLYRAFEDLEEAGVIARSGKTIRILNENKLRACCGHG